MRNYDVEEKMGIIRGFVNEPRRKSLLLNDSGKFDQLIACLDAIEDADLAIGAYLESEDNVNGSSYLHLYGLMQAFIIQQDALKFLSEALLKRQVSLIKKFKEIELIRRLRNITIGHPTKNYHKYYTQIVRAELDKGRMVALFWHNEGECLREEINLYKLIKDQRRCILEELNEIIRLLKEDEKKHKEKWRLQKLASFFHPTDSYILQKLYPFTHDDRAIAKSSLSRIEKVALAVKLALKERLTHLNTDEAVITNIEAIEALVTRYRDILNKPDTEFIDFEVLADGMKKYYQKIYDYCIALDEYYEEE